MTNGKKVNVVFVCLGNICRSPMAEFIFREMVTRRGLDENFTISSRATSNEEEGNPVYPPAKAILARHGINVGGKTAVVLTPEDASEADYVICMEERNVRDARRIVREADHRKICKLLDFAGGGDIADPWYTGGFERTYADIVRGLEGFMKGMDTYEL